MFNIVPKVAMLSYSNFGSSDSPESNLVTQSKGHRKTKRQFFHL
jgi:malate dehydrogenase (oxaloacetate-decarboxylating)(NADP+)